MSNDRPRPLGVLRPRNLTMIENIRRAADPAWRDRLERQQVLARLGRRFGLGASPVEAMSEYADCLQHELRAAPPPSRPAGHRGEPDG
jgi:hypothetical protein